MKPHKPALRRRAFTLIELLVVVSIIALLVAILLPSLSRARAQARSAVCESRLRTLGQGWTAYWSSNHDRTLPSRLPTFDFGGQGNPANQYRISTGLKYRPRWPALMQQFVGVPALDPPSPTRDRENYVNPVYVCPEVADWTDERNAAYGYNYQFLGNERVKSNGRIRNSAVPQTQIPKPAETVVIADSAGSAASFASTARLTYENGGRDEAALGNYGWLIDPPRLTTSSSHAGGKGSRRSAPDPRHSGKCNTLFGDGHAKATTLSSIGYGVAGDGRVVESGLDATNRFFSGTGTDETPP